MSNRVSCSLLCLPLIAVLSLLSACDSSAQNTINLSTPSDPAPSGPGAQKPVLGVSVPDAILNSRSIDLTQVSPTVVLGNNLNVEMTRSSDTQWTGSVNVDVNSLQSLKISWIEVYQGEILPLAEITRVVTVEETAVSVSLTAGDYNTNIDSDNDGSSNLAERNALTDPLDAGSTPATTPTPDSQINVKIPKIDPANAPTIDGFGAIYNSTELELTGEWQAAAQQGTEAGSGLFIDSLMINKGNTIVESNPFHRWAAMHDGTSLYILVLVDDLSVNQSDSSTMNDDDSIEIYIDGNNSNLEMYGDSDDRFFILPLQQFNSPAANSSNSDNGRIERGVTSAPLPTDIEWATGLATGPLSLRNPAERQDVYELRIGLASLGITVGNPFGIEIQINDDDDGGVRDSKWGWKHPARTNTDTDMTGQNPSFMATGALDL